MMYNRSKIKSIQSQGTWNTKAGDLMYKFEIELEDGSAGEVNARTTDRWSEGEEVQYDLQQSKHGPKLKLSKISDFSNIGEYSYGGTPESIRTDNPGTAYDNKNDRRQELIVNQFAIKAAIEWHTNEAPPNECSLRQVIVLADQLKSIVFNWDSKVEEIKNSKDETNLPF